MKFMMLMIPAVYQGRKPAPGFTPDPKKFEEMERFNEELGKAFKIESLNGLHPLAKRCARVVRQRQVFRDRRTVHRNERSIGRLLVGGRAVQGRSGEVGAALPGGRRRHH
jgi:hypothetical protein